ncbi:MAG: HupE/UreJ family protein, partial [Polyangiales bacterium]
EDIGLPKDSLLKALFAFNLGIEVGQLTIVAGAALAFWLIRAAVQALPGESSRRFGAFETAFAYLLGGIAAAFAIERTMALFS